MKEKGKKTKSTTRKIDNFACQHNHHCHDNLLARVVNSESFLGWNVALRFPLLCAKFVSGSAPELLMTTREGESSVLWLWDGLISGVAAVGGATEGLFTVPGAKSGFSRVAGVADGLCKEGVVVVGG